MFAPFGIETGRLLVAASLPFYFVPVRGRAEIATCRNRESTQQSPPQHKTQTVRNRAWWPGNRRGRTSPYGEPMVLSAREANLATRTRKIRAQLPGDSGTSAPWPASSLSSWRGAIPRVRRTVHSIGAESVPKVEPAIPLRHIDLQRASPSEARWTLPSLDRGRGPLSVCPDTEDVPR